ncbi:MAG: hypothetical protein ABII64_07055 [Elusimicrobiota bacterium]
MKRIFPVLLLSLIAFPAGMARPALGADSLSIETEYRLKSINFSNLDYNSATSSDTLNYYEQRVRISIGGKFSPGVEIGSRITAMEIQGAATNFFNAPYPRTDFTPFVENAYVKLSGIADSEMDLTVGKVPLEFGDGLIIADNGIGFNVIELDGSLQIPIPYVSWAPGKRFKYGSIKLPSKFRAFMSKISESVHEDTDNDIFGGSAAMEISRHEVEIGYFDSRDYSHTPYTRGTVSVPVISILKQFYDLRISRRLEYGSYSFEYARQNGFMRKPDLNTIMFNGTGMVMKGTLLRENTKLGKIEARALCAAFSGSESIGTLTDEETAFTPDHTKRWDGFKKGVYGELFGATPFDSFAALNPEYSGINTLNLGVSVMPLDMWTLSADHFWFSASRGAAGKDTTWIEQRFGGRYSLGNELDLAAKLTLNKYASLKLSYGRYIPPASEDFWQPYQDPVDRYAFEMTAKF